VHYSNIAYDIVYNIVYDIVYYIIGDVAVGQISHACGDVEGRWFIPKIKQYNNSNFKYYRSYLDSDKGFEPRTNRF
jgi:hypothetical protein